MFIVGGGALILWNALLGLAVLIIGPVIWYNSDSFCKSWRVNRHRNKWLLQHFGVEGRRRWLENERRVALYEVWLAASRSWNADKQHDWWLLWKAKTLLRNEPTAFNFPRLTPGGRYTPGLVYDGIRMKRQDFSEDPPWGRSDRVGFYTYRYDHQPDPAAHYPTGFLRNKDNESANQCRHGEPWGSDWLAAGFVKPFRRDDGVLVDPIKIVKSDMQSYAWSAGGVMSIFDDGGAVSREVYAAIREIEKRTGKSAMCNVITVPRPLKN